MTYERLNIAYTGIPSLEPASFFIKNSPEDITIENNLSYPQPVDTQRSKG